jgi:hypothetical protein
MKAPRGGVIRDFEDTFGLDIRFGLRGSVGGDAYAPPILGSAQTLLLYLVRALRPLFSHSTVFPVLPTSLPLR